MRAGLVKSLRCDVIIARFAARGGKLIKMRPHQIRTDNDYTEVVGGDCAVCAADDDV